MSVTPATRTMLSGLALAAVGCRGSSGAPGDTAAIVTWTDQSCAFDTEPYQMDGSFDVGSVPGCPIIVHNQGGVGFAYHDYFPFYEGVFAVCQSDVSYTGAEESGLLAALGVQETPALELPGYPCTDRQTGEVLYRETGLVHLDSSITGPYAGSGIETSFWLLGADGHIEWLYVPSGNGTVDCGGRGSFHGVMFGTPFFAPEPRVLDCD